MAGWKQALETGSFTASSESLVTINFTRTYDLDDNYYIVITRNTYTGSNVPTYQNQYFKITQNGSQQIYVWPYSGTGTITYYYTISNNVRESGSFTTPNVGPGSYYTATVSLQNTYSANDDCYIVPTGFTNNSNMAPYAEASHKINGNTTPVVVRNGAGRTTGWGTYTYVVICLNE